MSQPEIINIEGIPDEPACWDAWEVGNYYVGLELTIMGATLIKIMRKDDQTGYECGWSAGYIYGDILYLLNIAIEVIMQGKVNEAPTINKPRPWFNDHVEKLNIEKLKRCIQELPERLKAFTNNNSQP